MSINKNKTRFVIEIDKITAEQINEIAVNEFKTTSEMAAILIKEALIGRNAQHHEVKSEPSPKRAINYTKINKENEKEEHGFIRGADYYKRDIEDDENK